MSGIFKTKAEYESALAAATTDAEKMDVRLKYAGQIKDEIEEANKKGESETVTRLRLEAAELRAEMANNKAEGIEKEIERLKADNGKKSETNEKSVFESIAEDLRKKSIGDNEKVYKLKAAADITTANVVTSLAITQYDNQIDPIPTEPSVWANILPKKSITGDTYAYSEKKNRDGSVLPIAEGAQYPKIDFDWVGSKIDVKKLAAELAVSDETLESQLDAAADIRQEMNDQMTIKEEDQLMNGTGIGVNMAGLLSYATSFSAGTHALSVIAPNKLDVLSIGKSQIRVGTKKTRRANTVAMHPDDIASLKYIKTSTGEYVYNTLFSADGTMFDGMLIVDDPSIAAGTFLIFDRNATRYLVKREITIKQGWIDKQFIEGMNTFTISKRGNLLVKSNDTPALVKGTFSTAITALTKP